MNNVILTLHMRCTTYDIWGIVYPPRCHHTSGTQKISKVGRSEIYNESSGPLELCHWCYCLTNYFIYLEIKITLTSFLFPEDL